MREPSAAADAPSVVDRRAELARLRAFLAPPAPVTPAALLIEGPAGIGKSTLWRAGVEFAAVSGRTVLRAARGVLEYVIRRLGDAPVRVLISQRSTGAQPPPLGLQGRRVRLILEPFGVGATHRLLAERLQRSFPRPVVRRLHEVSGGNPYYALELGRVVIQRHTRLDPDDPLPVPASLGQLVEERFASLAPLTRQLVGRVVTVFDPRTALIAALAREDGLAGEIDVAVAAGALREEGDRLRVAHPVLGAAVYAQIGPERRRALHARLADGGEPGDEARALHLARASAEPDARVADELAAAAARARGRGATATAARMMEAAARLTPAADPGRVVELAMTAAACWIAAGDHARARALALENLDRPGLGRARAEVLYMLAWTPADGDTLAESSRMAREALARVRDDVGLEARIRLGAAFFAQARGRLDETAEQARLAVAAAQAADDPDTLAVALAIDGFGTVLRRGSLTAQARRALLEEAQDVCDRVAIIHQGRIVEAGEPAELVQRLGREVADFALAGGRDATALLAALHAQPGHVIQSGASVSVVSADSRPLTDRIGALPFAELGVSSVTVRTATLNDVFLALTAGEARPDLAAAAGGRA